MKISVLLVFVKGQYNDFRIDASETIVYYITFT